MGGRSGSARPAPHLAGGTSARLELAPSPESAHAAREFARQHLDWLDPGTLDTVMLLTSELVTNAILHARTPLQLTVEGNGRSVMLAVTDHDRGEPEQRPLDAERLDGRGIALVAALSREWGSSVHPAGKTVWCVLDAEPAGEAGAAGSPAGAGAGAGATGSRSGAAATADARA